MMLFPDRCASDLEFDKLLDLLSNGANSEATRARIRSQKFETEVSKISSAMHLVANYALGLSAGDFKAMGEFASVVDALGKVRPKNYVLAQEEIFEIKRLLEIHLQFTRTLDEEEMDERYPHLSSLIRSEVALIDFVKELSSVLDDKGEVRDDASPVLVQLRNARGKLLKKIDVTFASIIRQHKSNDVLLESEESFKNGRRVLAVRSERKRQIRGIIHDQSATGQTSYIEPEEIVMLNNELFDLENEEKKEIYKILLALCDKVRFHRDEISRINELVIELDFIRTKAVLANRLEAVMPELEDGARLHWVQARHPLLKLKNDMLNKVTVPSDIQLLGNNRFMVISGPNAGGKSITLKTIGLLQMMLQYGMLIPADATSKAGVFSSIMVDIGDQQSIENDLSTYSSRLQKMVGMMEKANSDSLILMDEFGSGTDPKTGGALAESILRHLMFLKSWGVVTTHYSNLKVFAFKNRGVVNACMEFDVKTITPTYKLTIGKPGSSFAFEIAENMKVPDVVLKNARRRLGENQVAVEDLLVTIQAQKKELDQKIEALDKKQERLDKLISSYERLSGELDYKRKKLKLQTKESRAALEAEFNRQLENTIREIQETKNLEKAKSLASEKREERKELYDELSDLQNEIIAFEKPAQRDIEIGDFVKMNNGNVSGKVEALKGDVAKVAFGAMMVEVPLRDIRLVKEPLKVNPRKSIQTNIFEKAAQFKPRLDIRGLKMEEAMVIMQNYLDEAVVVGTDRLEIIHGKGGGILKKVVREKAKEYPQISKVLHPSPEEGGDGISIVWFK